MKIAIDASRAFLHERTGIEEYSYQLIKNMRESLKDYNVTLFLRSNTKENVDFQLPENWKVKELWAPKYWTYVRLSLALFLGRYDRLFVPSHIVPPFHPKRTVVTVHGLEYEMTPEAFSDFEIHRMRRGIKNSCKWAKYIICVSNNTKKDLMELYDIPREKIRVIYEGKNLPTIVSNSVTTKIINSFGLEFGSYLIFVGRLETRKNIINILQAYEMLREHFKITEKLVLVGKEGHGWEEIQQKIDEHFFRDDIIITGFVSDEEKGALMRGASVFVFPTLYEGFGLPVLESQELGVPVVTSNSSSLKEVAGESALLVDPQKPSEIAKAINELLTNEELAKEIIQKGIDNLDRFDWKRAGELTSRVILAGHNK